ncbi:MAG: DUF4868 domain-containing protein [Gemella haemolysans]|uniref:Kiwa anti-phage protein KwaB-like domain-containing protein n=1 Tax=Gemella haemolysans TaxID=1379 RepID=UPI00290D9237|nr:Kiwa anti-phage protein KwaB-like domain-containing protein [Gemella haemolysans]MDU4713380.1 DUF4868 domain-containing protein [Gemella haemolysans]
MSIDKLKSVFKNVTTCEAWSLQLLQIKNSKKNGTSYCGREITLSPKGTLKNFLTEISNIYSSSEGRLEEKYENVREYDGSTLSNTIYKLNSDNKLISTEYTELIKAIGNPDSELDLLKFSAKAYVLKGIVTVDSEELSIKLISMKNPITILKHKYMHTNGTFKEISNKVISLRTFIDVVIIDDIIYMLTLDGEKLFNMKRAYKSICEKQIINIINSNIINDAEIFSNIASSRHNPRKFVSFNKSHLSKLEDAVMRKEIGEKFEIPLDGDKFDMNQQGAADKLVKLLCDRGMIEPFDDNPIEVSGAKKWE